MNEPETNNTIGFIPRIFSCDYERALMTLNMAKGIINPLL